MNTIAPAPLAKIILTCPDKDGYTVAAHAHVFLHGRLFKITEVYRGNGPDAMYGVAERVKLTTEMMRMAFDATQIRLVIEPDALDALGPDIAQELLADFHKGLNA